MNMNHLSTDEQESLDLEESLNLSTIKAVNKAHRLHDRNLEFRAESTRLRAEARKLLNRAEHVDREAKKIKATAKVATVLSESLQYESLLLRLRRNDKDTTEVNGRAFPLGHGKVLGEALLHNTAVTKMNLYLPTMLSGTKENKAKKEIASLIRFLSKNLLIDLAVCVNEDENESHSPMISSDLLKAISKCTRIERLMWGLPVDPSFFRRAMANLQALRDLDIRFLQPASYYSESQRETIAAAFQSASALQKLKLCAEDDPDLLTRILSTVADTMPPLQELVVVEAGDTYDDFHNALCRVLRSIGTIKRFELLDFLLSEQDMTGLLDALQLQSVAKLSFRKCVMLESSEDVLLSLLQTRTTDNNGAIVVNSSLRELHVSCKDEEDLTEDESRDFADSILVALSGAMGNDANELDVDQPPYLPTIGSQLESLSLGFVDPSFFDVLRDNVDRVRLQRLELIGLSQAACVAFGKCIPHLTTIRTLKVANVDADGIVWILHGLKGNGSICEVVATDDDDTTRDFSPTQLRLIDAYCQRNKLLSQLVESEPSLDDNVCHGTSADNDCTGSAVMSARTKASSETVADTTVHHHAELVVRPPLLQAAMQIPNNRLTVLIRGLLVLGQSFKDELDGKSSPADLS